MDVLPLRAVLNRAYARLLQDRDDKQRAEVLDELYAPEPDDEQDTIRRVAAFATWAEQHGGE